MLIKAIVDKPPFDFNLTKKNLLNFNITLDLKIDTKML